MPTLANPLTTDRALLAVLRDGEPVRFTARGSSMWPSVRDGATVEVSPCDPKALRRGELVAFERSDRLVVHRVREVLSAGLRCAGDARFRGDGVVYFSDVRGRGRVCSQPPLRLALPRSLPIALLLRAAVGTLRRVVPW